MFANAIATVTTIADTLSIIARLHLFVSPLQFTEINISIVATSHRSQIACTNTSDFVTHPILENRYEQNVHQCLLRRPSPTSLTSSKLLQTTGSRLQRARASARAVSKRHLELFAG
jgi:hypothetical protein